MKAKAIESYNLNNLDLRVKLITDPVDYFFLKIITLIYFMLASKEVKVLLIVDFNYDANIRQKGLFIL